MLWAMLSLVGSLTFSTARESLIWVALYCVLTVVSGLIDAQVVAVAPFVPLTPVVRLFFVLNITLISVSVRPRHLAQPAAAFGHRGARGR